MRSKGIFGVLTFCFICCSCTLSPDYGGPPPPNLPLRIAVTHMNGSTGNVLLTDSVGVIESDLGAGEVVGYGGGLLYLKLVDSGGVGLYAKWPNHDLKIRHLQLPSLRSRATVAMTGSVIGVESPDHRLIVYFADEQQQFIVGKDWIEGSTFDVDGFDGLLAHMSRSENNVPRVTVSDAHTGRILIEREVASNTDSGSLGVHLIEFRNQVLFTSGDTIFRCSIKNGECTALGQGDQAQASLDERSVCFRGNDGELYLINESSPESRRLTNSPRLHKEIQDWSGEGHKILYLEWNAEDPSAKKALKLLEIETGQTSVIDTDAGPACFFE
jgi:hypothetical protein